MKTQNKIIYNTKDYDLFEQDDSNRDFRNNKPLKKSMEENGFLSEHPIVVVPAVNGKFRVKDGGHRLSYAKSMGLPVFYVVGTDAVSISDINNTQKSWCVSDYVSSYCRLGNSDYEYLNRWSETNRVPVGIAAKLLGGSTSVKLLDGEFKVNHSAHAEGVMVVINCVASKGQKWARQAKFVNAVSSVIRWGGVGAGDLTKKIDAAPHMLLPVANTEQGIQMLENIYNYRNRDRKQICYSVQQNIRQAVAKRGKAFGESRKKK